MNPADIASIELGGLPPAATAASDHPEPAVVAVGGSTQVNQGILIAYDSAMPTQPAADVTYSLLFAQLAADAQNDRRTAPDAWMSVWLDVLLLSAAAAACLLIVALSLRTIPLRNSFSSEAEATPGVGAG